MNCSECEARISEFLDGELSDLSSQVVREHLQSCLDCQRLASEFLSLKFQILQAMDSILVPAYLEEQILASIQIEQKTASKQVWLTSLILGIVPIMEYLGNNWLSARIGNFPSLTSLFIEAILFVALVNLPLIGFLFLTGSAIMGLGVVLTLIWMRFKHRRKLD